MKGIHEGLTRHNPPGVDGSMGTKGFGSVNDTGRDSKKPAATPKTLGPRNA